MGGIIGLVCCILCAFPLFVIGHYNKNSREPITFWAGDKSFKENISCHTGILRGIKLPAFPECALTGYPPRGAFCGTASGLHHYLAP